MRGAAAGKGHRGRSSALAPALAAALLACSSLAACGGRGGFGPAALWRDVSGASDAARPAPPGLDKPFPSLGSVPPRPERPSPEARDAITAALAADRSRSREPVALRGAGGGDAGGAAPAAGMAAGPPPRPALAAAPRVPWTDEAPRPAAPAPAAASPTPPAAAPTPRPQAPAVPDAPPAPPPSDMLEAPPPPPPSDLLAPQPPPPARR